MELIHRVGLNRPENWTGQPAMRVDELMKVADEQGYVSLQPVEDLLYNKLTDESYAEYGILKMLSKFSKQTTNQTERYAEFMPAHPYIFLGPSHACLSIVINHNHNHQIIQLSLPPPFRPPPLHSRKNF